MGPLLAGRGFLVRTLLLPGHGTKPEDLMSPDFRDWQQLVEDQVALLKEEVEQIYLGGFSTGANLVTEYALGDPSVQGLLLFSPAFKSDSALDWVTPILSWFRPWLMEPDDSRPHQSEVRYMNTPTNGFALYYKSSRAVRNALARRRFDKPALLVVTEHDSVVDVASIREIFERRFGHPASRMIWYGELAAGEQQDRRILVRSDSLPEQNISQFSHMSVLFSPRNPLYGIGADQRICWNGQSPEDYASCLAGEQVWYSAWGYRESGKVHARLTYNPYFDWQLEVMDSVLAAAN
ncbi:alpha/beta hydrolase [Microbulbifer taiwanensis]|uniref:alpha/beta hydrolase n=1 Tax=Microbulbifer taiwanensis TaxID=986746 RepID=UPI00361F8C40